MQVQRESWFSGCQVTETQSNCLGHLEILKKWYVVLVFSMVLEEKLGLAPSSIDNALSKQERFWLDKISGLQLELPICYDRRRNLDPLLIYLSKMD